MPTLSPVKNGLAVMKCAIAIAAAPSTPAISEPASIDLAPRLSGDPLQAEREGERGERQRALLAEARRAVGGEYAAIRRSGGSRASRRAQRESARWSAGCAASMPSRRRRSVSPAKSTAAAGRPKRRMRPFRIGRVPISSGVSGGPKATAMQARPATHDREPGEHLHRPVEADPDDAGGAERQRERDEAVGESDRRWRRKRQHRARRVESRRGRHVVVGPACDQPLGHGGEDAARISAAMPIAGRVSKGTWRR